MAIVFRGVMTANDMFTYENIRQIHIKEMKSSSLTKIDPNFYELFFDNLKNLKEEYQRLLGKSQNEAGTVMLGEEIRKLKSLINSIHERRERKIIFLAQIEARGGSPNTKNLTNLERIFYDELVPILKRTRFKLESMDNGENKFVPAPADSKIDDITVANSEAETKINSDNAVKFNGKEKSPINLESHSENIGDGKKLLLVQILKDGINFQDNSTKKYSLKKEDVINLPAQYAKVLVKRGAARIIEDSF